MKHAGIYICPGLSPLARGTRLRFIPAGAGNTLRRSAFFASRSVYPRWRGEHKK
ncbi:hypothetical protein ECP03022939_2730 [Escherichia coli P0302293.9]|nr:hypothetical protein ECP03022939_2730 [Escherichia coli P0302293.9]